MSHSPKDRHTVRVDSGPIDHLSVSCMWHVAFATSLSSRHGAKPKGRSGMEARVVISVDTCFNWKDLSALLILEKCFGPDWERRQLSWKPCPFYCHWEITMSDL